MSGYCLFPFPSTQLSVVSSKWVLFAFLVLFSFAQQRQRDHGFVGLLTAGNFFLESFELYPRVLHTRFDAENNNALSMVVAVADDIRETRRAKFVGTPC